MSDLTSVEVEAKRSLKRAALLAVALLTSACVIIAERELEAGPEQFRFDLRPGSGFGAEADDLAGRFDDEEPVRAEHVAWVETPLGRVDILDTVEIVEGAEQRCRTVITPRLATKACGDGFEEPQPTEIRNEGTISDGDWQVTQVGAGEAISAVRATADDGTVYEATIVRGAGVVAYPIHRGAISIQGLGPSGEQVGVAIIAGGMRH